MSEAMELALSLLRDGTLRIDDEGCIWRERAIIRGVSKPISSRRAENQGNKGYLRLTLQSDGRLVSVMAHRVIWTWHKGPIPAGMQINHKDLNKKHNRLDNLELVDGAGNIQHSYANGRAVPWSKVNRSGSWRGRPMVTHEQIAAMCAMRAGGTTLKEIAHHFGIAISHVHRLTTPP